MNKEIKQTHYLFIIDIVTVIVSSFFLFKFESSYWLVKGAAVNKVAGFGDIFHDWAIVLFIALPLITISQIALSALINKKDVSFVLLAKTIAFGASLIFINWNKIIAEISKMQNWKALLLVIIGTTLFGVYMMFVKKVFDSKIADKWYVPIIAAIIGIGLTIIY